MAEQVPGLTTAGWLDLAEDLSERDDVLADRGPQTAAVWRACCMADLWKEAWYDGERRDRAE